mmetsp:Transcript_10832/g.31051  ORF Transcript_10832/g.31051 Transcript_10832/m.31051 type:complete len:107 (-) Transcript_10832:145-465(-)
MLPMAASSMLVGDIPQLPSHHTTMCSETRRSISASSLPPSVVKRIAPNHTTTQLTTIKPHHHNSNNIFHNFSPRSTISNDAWISIASSNHINALTNNATTAHKPSA